MRSVRKAIAGRGAHLDMLGCAESPRRPHPLTGSMDRCKFLGQVQAPRIVPKHPHFKGVRPSLPTISTFRQITPTHQVCRGHLEKVLTVQFSAHHANLLRPELAQLPDLCS